MAFCPKCGKEVADDAKFCTSCGTQLGEAEAKAEANPAVDGASTQEQIADKAKELMNTPDLTAEYDQADIDANKGMALLSYIGLLVLIPILAAPNSRYARFHANQGLVLWIASMIISAVAVIPILGWIVSFVGGIVTFMLMIIGIVNAAGGKAKQLPIIGKFTLIK